MMMMMIMTLTPEGVGTMISKGIKRHGYDGLEEKFKTNDENRR